MRSANVWFAAVAVMFSENENSPSCAELAKAPPRASARATVICVMPIPVLKAVPLAIKPTVPAAPAVVSVFVTEKGIVQVTKYEPALGNVKTPVAEL